MKFENFPVSALIGPLEIIKYNEDKVQFFGALRCCKEKLIEYEALMQEDKYTTGFVFAKEKVVESILNDWSQITDCFYPAGIIKTAINHGVVVALCFSDYHDSEYDWLFTGPDKQIKNFYRLINEH